MLKASPFSPLYPQKQTSERTSREVCFVPISTKMHCGKQRSYSIIGEREQIAGDVDAKRRPVKASAEIAAGLAIVGF
jgi:hypothetical protein